ncbi:hypothetical protein IMZ48_47665 [Candidatus Bathyarchaeota archaeon]|nr:hypothetical protein [Candidatus Bathyarchaeota archaeon]
MSSPSSGFAVRKESCGFLKGCGEASGFDACCPNENESFCRQGKNFYVREPLPLKHRRVKINQR